MSGTGAGHTGAGVPVGEAARRLGINYETLRKRIKRGTLPAYKAGDRWYVLLDGVPDTPPDNVPGHHHRPPDPVPDGPGTPAPDRAVTPAEVERAINSTTDRYVLHLEGIRDSLARAYQGQLAAQSATIAAKDSALADKDAVIAELRRRAEVAEAERDAMRAQAAPPPRSDEEGPQAGASSPASSAGRWGRLRGWWRGGAG